MRCIAPPLLNKNSIFRIEVISTNDAGSYYRLVSTYVPEISKEMVARRHTKLGENSGPAYANHALRFLRALLNFAMAQYETPRGAPVLIENPVNRLKTTRAWYRVERRRTFLKSHQRAAWYAAVQRGHRKRGRQGRAAGPL